MEQELKCNPSSDAIGTISRRLDFSNSANRFHFDRPVSLADRPCSERWRFQMACSRPQNSNF